MSAPQWLRTQLAGPQGWLARPMARLLNRGNGADYKRALSHLAAKPGDHVLELGFGGGVALPALLEAGATVTGVEPAVSMRARAFRKHSWALAEGKLTILDARAEALPDGPFTHAISMNTVYFWDDVQAGFSELRRVVTNTVLLGVAGPDHLTSLGFPDSGFRVEAPDWYAAELEKVGFTVTSVAPEQEPGCTLLLAR